MKNNDWKDRLNVVYSTNPDFNYDMDDDQEQVTLDKNKQNLRVSLDRKKPWRQSSYTHHRIRWNRE